MEQLFSLVNSFIEQARSFKTKSGLSLSSRQGRLKPNPVYLTFVTTYLHLQTNDVSIQVNGEVFLHWIALNLSLDNDWIVIRRQ
jgi:hypothetical protein